MFLPGLSTAWTVTDSAHDQQFQISVVDDTTRGLAGSITQISSGTTLATITLDRSGSGSITYSDGSTAIVTNWTGGGIRLAGFSSSPELCVTVGKWVSVLMPTLGYGRVVGDAELIVRSRPEKMRLYNRTRNAEGIPASRQWNSAPIRGSSYQIAANRWNTFQGAARSRGVNPFRLASAEIREKLRESLFSGT
jgi:hypothetical protein